MTSPITSSLPAIIPAPLVSGAAGVRVVALPRPFHDDRVTGEVPAGMSIDEIVGELVQAQAVHPSLIRAMRVTVAGRDGVEEMIPYEAWPRVRPREGTQVSIKVIPQGGGGGGGGGKNPLRTVLQVILIVVAIIVSVYTGNPGAGALIPLLGPMKLNARRP